MSDGKSFAGRRVALIAFGQELARGEVGLHTACTPRRLIEDVTCSGERTLTRYIYRIKGDALTLCCLLPECGTSTSYPTDFVPRDGVLVFVFKRKKP